MQLAPQQTSLTTRLSLQIEQIAATSELGALQARYRSKRQKLLAFFGLLWMAYLIVLFSVVFFLISAADRTWWVWLTWLFLMSILFLGIYALFSTLVTAKLEVFVYSAGLIYHKKDSFEAVRWDQVEAYWKDISISRDSDTSDTFHYRLQRSDGTILDFPDDIEAMKILGELIQRNADQHLLPRTIATYRAGNPVTFDEITANTHGVSVERGHKMLLWSEIESIQVDDETLDIYKKAQERTWHHQRVARIASPGVLEGLGNYSIQQLADQQLFHVLAAYRAGSPVTFGRLSLNQQGIALDNGKKFLPWKDVRTVDLDVKERKLSVYSSNKLLGWKTLSTWMTPDSLVLKGLSDHILSELAQTRRARVQHQLPQLLATYNAGLPLTFGRLSLSLQGVAIDGGKKFLPWDDVSYLRLGTYIGGEQLAISKKGRVIVTWQMLPLRELEDADLLREVIECITGQPA